MILKLQNNLIYILIILLSFQLSYWGLFPSVYSVLRIFIIGIVLILFFINIKEKIESLRKNIFISSITTLTLLLFSILFFLSGIFPVKIEMILDILMIVMVIMISFNINLDEKKIINLSLFFSLSILFSSLSIVFFYANGFVINENYLPVPKNQLAPIFSIGVVTGIFLFFKVTDIRKYFFLISAILLLLCILTIRGRSVLFSLFIVMLLFFTFFIKSNKVRFYLLIFSVFFLFLLSDFIYNSLFLNYDTTDINSISTGRVGTYEESIDLIMEYPFFGEFGYIKTNTYTTHNYLLNVLVKYGFVGSILFLVIYFKILLKILKGIYWNNYNIFELGLLPTLILFCVSLFEYSFPYSPGTSTFFSFFLFGQYLKYISNDTSRQFIHK